MKTIRYILTIMVAALLLSGCRSSSVARKQKVQQEENMRLVHELMTVPPVSELTASLSLNLEGTRVSGQLRMRRGRSIQLSASMLGLVEVARIEFLPDMVVVMDRFHNLYSVCHYADIPLRNELGLDFEVVEAFFWNRVFCPGTRTVDDAAARLDVLLPDEKGNVRIADTEYGYSFLTNGKDRLNAVSKKSDGFGFAISYGDFTEVSKNWYYPLDLQITINSATSEVGATIRMSSVQTEKKNWADRTQVTRRMKQVSLEELLDNLDL